MCVASQLTDLLPNNRLCVINVSKINNIVSVGVNDERLTMKFVETCHDTDGSINRLNKGRRYQYRTALINM